MAEASTIPIIYECAPDEDGEDGIRDYAAELAAWLAAQPQDAWLMFVRNMSWDSMDGLLRPMIDDPACDIAIIARIFWDSGPGWRAANPGGRQEHAAMMDRILANLGQGFYRPSALALNRLELLDQVQDYAQAVRSQRAAGRPPAFRPDRRLLGPFPGREADPPRGNAATEQHLDDIFLGLGSSCFYRSHKAWRDASEGNYALRHYLTLPPVNAASRNLDHLDELEHITALYGSIEQYTRARREIADRPFAGRATPPSVRGVLRWAQRYLRGNDQF